MKLIFDLLYVYLLSNYTVSKRNAPIMHSLNIKDVELMAITFVRVAKIASKMAEYFRNHGTCGKSVKNHNTDEKD